jgi:hypothetical protein
MGFEGVGQGDEALNVAPASAQPIKFCSWGFASHDIVWGIFDLAGNR